MIRITYEKSPGNTEHVDTTLGRDELLAKIEKGRRFRVPRKSDEVIVSARTVNPARFTAVVDLETDERIWPIEPPEDHPPSTA